MNFITVDTRYILICRLSMTVCFVCTPAVNRYWESLCVVQSVDKGIRVVEPNSLYLLEYSGSVFCRLGVLLLHYDSLVWLNLMLARKYYISLVNEDLLYIVFPSLYLIG